MNRSNVWIASLAALLLALPGPARAAEDGAELKARTHFAAGEYKQALDIYARLYVETLHPTYLRNVGRCHQNLGDADKAITSFREYLRKAKELSPDQRAEIEGYIAEMEQLKRSRAVASVAAAPQPAAEASPALVGPPSVTAQAATESESGPVYKRVWFWTVVAGAAAASVTAAVLLSGDRSPVRGNVGLVDLRDKVAP